MPLWPNVSRNRPTAQLTLIPKSALSVAPFYRNVSARRKAQQWQDDGGQELAGKDADQQGESPARQCLTFALGRGPQAILKSRTAGSGRGVLRI
jgi:hypothetical protein